MAKAPRIYTRTGDDGTTGLVGGQRVRKDTARIECFGSVDECSTVIGLARCSLAEHGGRERAVVLDRWLDWVQDVLFNLGSDLATLDADRRPAAPTVADGDATLLERAIDEAQRDLAPLTRFIHPGGSYAGAFLHQARTVCRRAERLIVALSRSETVAPAALRFINRLSDALFVWARWINAELGSEEHTWDPASKPPDASV